jgi:hypothetical protein
MPFRKQLDERAAEALPACHAIAKVPIPVEPRRYAIRISGRARRFGVAVHTSLTDCEFSARRVIRGTSRRRLGAAENASRGSHL